MTRGEIKRDSERTYSQDMSALSDQTVAQCIRSWLSECARTKHPLTLVLSGTDYAIPLRKPSRHTLCDEDDPRDVR
eukprot:3941653-Rhodomonas_salina.2